MNKPLLSGGLTDRGNQKRLNTDTRVVHLLSQHHKKHVPLVLHIFPSKPQKITTLDPVPDLLFWESWVNNVHNSVNLRGHSLLFFFAFQLLHIINRRECWSHKAPSNGDRRFGNVRGDNNFPSRLIRVAWHRSWRSEFSPSLYFVKSLFHSLLNKKPLLSTLTKPQFEDHTNRVRRFCPACEGARLSRVEQHSPVLRYRGSYILGQSAISIRFHNCSTKAKKHIKTNDRNQFTCRHAFSISSSPVRKSSTSPSRLKNVSVVMWRYKGYWFTFICRVTSAPYCPKKERISR